MDLMPIRTPMETSYYPHHYIQVYPRDRRVKCSWLHSLSKDTDGQLYVTAFECHPYGRRFYKSDLTPESWAEIVTPERLKELRKVRKPRKSYKLDHSYILERENSRRYRFCTPYRNVECPQFTVGRKHLIKFCKAILEDEGEL